MVSLSLSPPSLHPYENKALSLYIEDITRWREDMNFMLEWQEQYLTGP